MNIETREIRDVNDLTEDEKRSGKWIPARRKYAQRQPLSDADFARIVAANDRRLRRARTKAQARRKLAKASKRRNRQ
jgi:hypothetical protein